MSEILRRQIEKITPLTDQEFEYILSHFTLKKFKKHQILIQEGDTVQNDYFVMNGLLKSFLPESRRQRTYYAICNGRLVDYRLSSVF
jgi:CRP-like cAMP-binding protein